MRRAGGGLLEDPFLSGSRGDRRKDFTRMLKEINGERERRSKREMVEVTKTKSTVNFFSVGD